ncbi:MAG: CDP-diacylglycerol--serine O-phosphatidyltransferase [Bacteroidales bacterium]|nr:CDP-diacylglycerol--serine O-phosphatidyltransferase [Bacteroidales bacterium]
MKLINLPNIITCCNLLCGCMAVFFGLNGEVGTASLYIILGAVFDFFDGMAARLLNISGPIGKELDSLADMVTFGVAPSVLCYQILGSYTLPYGWLPLLAFVMAAFSALRLAKFNCDERQSLSFIGLPTPANALLWIGFIHLNAIGLIHEALNGWYYLAAMFLLSWLLISEVPMFSLKIKSGHMGWAENKVRYSFLAACVAIFAVTAIAGPEYFKASPAYIILLYIILSAVSAKKQ